MTTKIYKSYSEFCDREDKKENGVNESFSKNNPNYKDMNKENEGCWSCSRCYGCYDCSDCYDCYGCSYKKETKKDNILLNPPKIKNIHNTLLNAVNKPQALNMSTWHTCDTTHCRAGWVVTLAGKEGKELEAKTSTLFAAMMIYKASSPIRVSPPRFFDTNDKAMADIKKCAKEEAKA